MHYMDDWYVLASRPNVYALIYYCGCNDACCGYAGAVLYTRSPRFEDLSTQAFAGCGVCRVDVDILYIYIYIFYTYIYIYVCVSYRVTK